MLSASNGAVSILLALVPILLVLSVAPAGAAPNPMLHFAGFAMWGNADDAKISFPYTGAMLSPNGEDLAVLNRALASRVASESYDNISISSDLANYKTESALVVACVLVWEDVSFEKVGSATKVAMNLQAQALVFDYKTRSIVAVYPFGVQFIDAFAGDPDKSRLLANFRSQIMSEEGLVGSFARVLHRVNIKKGFGRRIQLNSIELSDAAASQFAQVGLDRRHATLVLQHAFERYLSANGDVPVVPHSTNQAIGGTMALRLMNGDVFNLTLPVADYHVSLLLENARKVEISRTSSEVAIAFASYLSASISQPLSGTKFLDGSFKFATVKVVPSKGTVDERSAFQESLLAISDQLTRQFRTPSRDWSKQWVVRLSNQDAFEEVSQLLERCR